MGGAARVFRVQPGEARKVGLIFGLMFVTSAGLAVGESGIEALFFERVGADALPLIYLGQGAAGLAAMLVLTGALPRVERRRAYVAIPVLLGGAVLIGRALLATEARWIYAVLWLTVTCAVLLHAVFLWGTAGLVTDTRRAKRLFPLFGGGSILGAVVGGLSTRPLAALVGTENLLFVWAFALLCGAVLCAAVLGVRRSQRASRNPASRRRPSATREVAQALFFVRRSPLLAWMTIAAVLFSLLFYVLYLPYAEAAAARYPDPDDLAGFFGIYWAAGTAVAFLVSMLLTNRLLGRFGAAAMVFVLPLLYLGSFGVVVASSTFATLAVVRFGLGVWVQGVSSPAWETLVNVVPESRRDAVRACLNGGATQVGTALAGLVTLIGDALDARQLAMVGLVASVTTGVVAWRIRRSYTTALVEAIRAGRPRVFDDPIPNAAVALGHDAQAVTMAAAAMDDPDPRMRRLASELLADADDDRAARALRDALEDADGLVRARAVEALAATGRLIDVELGDALADEDAAVRLAAVRGLGTAPTMPAMVNDDDASVAAAAAIRLLAVDRTGAATGALRRLLSDEDPEIRLAVVRQLPDAPAGEVTDLVTDTLRDPSPAVRAAAVDALAAANPRVAAPAAIDALASPEAVVRTAALTSLDRLDRRGFEEELDRFIGDWSSLAMRDGAVAAAVPGNGDASELLRDALLARARARALVALAASSVTNDDRAAMRVALDILGQGQTSEQANALETIDAASSSPVVRSLLRLWEPSSIGERPTVDRTSWREAAATDDDPFIRACAELVGPTRHEGDSMARSPGSMAAVEFVLVLRKIPLFAALEPADLQRVAAIAEERSYAEGEVIGWEGELGDEMHVVLDGTVRVVRGDEETIARRGSGEFVGEMSVITRSPRMASLIAEGDVRTVRIGYREFEGMVRERPDIALAVMRGLAERLTER